MLMGGVRGHETVTVCTFVNVHEDIVDVTSVVVNCPADRSTLTYCRAQEQTHTMTRCCSTDPRSA